MRAVKPRGGKVESRASCHAEGGQRWATGSSRILALAISRILPETLVRGWGGGGSLGGLEGEMGGWVVG